MVPTLFCRSCDHQHHATPPSDLMCPKCKGVLRPPLSDTEVAALRDKRLPDIQEGGHNAFTCDECAGRSHCMYAFDAYNTSGDCLASK